MTLTFPNCIEQICKKGKNVFSLNGYFSTWCWSSKSQYLYNVDFDNKILPAFDNDKPEMKFIGFGSMI